MKKMIILIIAILLLCGCENKNDNKYSEKPTVAKFFYIYTDEDTCVEYFVSHGTYNIGNVTPRYNQDGTLKLNKQCLRDLEAEYD